MLVYIKNSAIKVRRTQKRAPKKRKKKRGHAPFSSSCFVYGRTPLWCPHKRAAAEGIQITCACPLGACEQGLTCGSSLSAGTPQTGGLQKSRVDDAKERGGGALGERSEEEEEEWMKWQRSGESDRRTNVIAQVRQKQPANHCTRLKQTKITMHIKHQH